MEANLPYLQLRAELRRMWLQRVQEAGMQERALLSIFAVENRVHEIKFRLFFSQVWTLNMSTLQANYITKGENTR